jgi:hypothetical protein
MPAPTTYRDILLSARMERKRIVRLRKAAELRDESEDSVRRHLRGKEIQLGDRNIGFRLEDVLDLPPEDTTKAAE